MNPSVRRRELLIVRHPETEANVQGRLVGRGDTEYTELGHRQVEWLAKRIVAWQPDVIVSSPLRRALVAARRASEEGAIPLTTDPRLTELDFGEAEGLTFEQIAEVGLPFDFRNVEAPVASGGESRDDILARSVQVVDEQLVDDRRSAIVTHGGVFRSMLVYVLGLPHEAMWSFDIDPAALAELAIVDGRGMLVRFESAVGPTAAGLA